MAKRILLGLAILFAVLVFLFTLLVVALVIFGTSTASGVTLPNGCTVSASARSLYLGVESNGNSAIVRTMRTKVVIEPTKFIIDDQFTGVIPAGAKAVDIKIDGRDVEITADGVPATPARP